MPARRSKKRPLAVPDSARRLARTERRLREVERRYELVMGAINESVFDWDIARDRFSTSESMQRLLGLPAGSFTLHDWQQRVHPDDFARFRDATVAHLKGKSRRFECDYRYRVDDGRWRWARTHGVAVRGRNGRAVRMIGSTGDITELKERERELAEQKAILETTLENIDQGITMVDRELRTIALNRRFLELLGFPPERFARGFHMEEAFRFNAERGEYGPGDVEEQVRARVALSLRFEPHAFERTRPDGRVIAVRGKPLPDGGGFVSTYTDVTEQRRAERALTTSEQRYALATSAATEGIYEWNLEAGTLFLTERAKAFFSLTAEQLTPAAWNKRIHAEDFADYRAALLDHFKSRTPQLEHEYRIADGRGGYRWVLDRGIGVRDAAGRVTKLVGALSDVTQRKRAEIELRRARDDAERALERQTAMADVLRVMSESGMDLAPVFEAIMRNAIRLCGASFGVVFRFDGRLQHIAALHNFTPEAAKILRSRYPGPPDPGQTSGRAILNRSVERVEDIRRHPGGAQLSATGGWRRILSVPLLRENEPVGAISVAWTEPGPIADDQVELLKTFADQASIAIENVRLFNETKDALDRQTATAEILRVMAATPSDVGPVFEAIVRSGLRLFPGSGVTVACPEGGQVRLMAIADRDPERARRWTERFPFPLTREYMHGAAILDCRMVDMPDVETMDESFAAGKRNFAASGYRAMTVVPMNRDGEAIGTIAVVRDAPGPLSDKQIALLRTFADQAVIAIENVRLFNETREALEQQKASSEVLGAISSSIGDTSPAFDKILESCQRLFAGTIVGLNLVREDGMLHIGAYHGAHRDDFERIFPIPLTPASGSGLAILERRVVHYPDAQDETEVPERTRNGCKAIGIRSAIFAPVLWEGRGLGAIFVGRDHLSSFSGKEISLLRTFADQAAIAIENVRLFNETRQTLEQQTAIAEVLKVMAASPSDVQPVFDVIVQSARRLIGGFSADLALVKDGNLHLAAFTRLDAAKDESLRGQFPVPLSGSPMADAVLTGATQIVTDVQTDARIREVVRKSAPIRGFGSFVIVPLLREGTAIGNLTVSRATAGLFSEHDIGLLRTFADQAVIAIENVRMFNEIQDTSRQLEIASRHKSEFLANMSHELRTPLNAIIGFTRIVMRKSKDRLEPLQYENLDKILASGQHLLALINSILDLSKIEAGRVEVHPVEIGLAPVLEQCARTVEPLVDAGAVALVREFGADLPQMYVDEEKLRQIVLNLLGNAVKFTERGTVRLQAQAANGSVAIAVSDTGIGIPPDKLDLVFEQFEQLDAGSTRRHGGSGLGLAIARRMARLMGGEITAESALGSGSRFTLTLPLRYRG